jgi:hypothetical protein
VDLRQRGLAAGVDAAAFDAARDGTARLPHRIHPCVAMALLPPSL